MVNQDGLASSTDIPAPVFHVDGAGRVLQSNPPGDRLLGLLGCGPDAPLPEPWRTRAAAALTSGHRLRHELQAGVRRFEVVLAPNQVRGTVCVVGMDVTDSQATQGPRDSWVTLERMVEHLEVGILMEDEAGRIVLANPTFCRLFDIPVPWTELRGLDCGTAARQAAALFVDPEAFVARIDVLQAERRSVHGDVLERTDGRVLGRDYLPLSEGGRDAGTLWQYRDLTEARRAAAALERAKEAAEAADQAKGAFLATMSHEIRTPLNAILGMTELALGTRLDPEQQDFLRSVRANSEALLNLLSDLLDFSKMEADQMELHHEAFDVVRLVEEVAEIMAPRAVTKGIQLLCRTGRRSSLRVMGDGPRVRQILMNLVGNAVKFTEAGQVTLRLEAELGSSGSAGLRIAVEDTGRGIAPEHLARLFERYYRVPGERAGGTGLGLHIAAQLAARMGGGLTARSVPGEGSTFELTLALPVGRGVSAARPDLGGREALVVHPPTAGLAPVLDILAGLEIWAEVVATGPEAMARLARAPHPDVVIADVDAEHVALALRRARVPTVLLHDLGDVHLELEHVSARVSRPVLWSNLMDALCKVLTGESAEALTADLPAVVAGTRVLLVEDNPDNQRVAVKALERHGAVVEVAGDGEGAVRAAGRGWDLILMDVDLPGIDGVEATRRIRAAGLEAVPIVAFTAHATVAVRQRCLQAGMTDFLAKPAPSQALLELLARHVQRSHAVLVVDDAADSRMLLRRFLQGEPDVAVHEAASAQEALEQLGRLPFALVLMDLDLGGVGGEEALETLRTQGYTMPVLAVTGHDDPAVKARCLAAGFSGFVLKPVRRPAFLAQVRAVLAPPSGLTPLPRLELLDPDVAALLPGYLARRREDVERLETLLADGDLDAVRRLGHQLKGSGGSYGVPELSALGADLEDAAGAGDLERARRARAALARLLVSLG